MVEQGGLATIPSRTGQGGSDYWQLFPIKMVDTNYEGQISFQNGGNRFGDCQLTLSNRQTTGANLEFFFSGSGTTAAFLVGWSITGFSDGGATQQNRKCIKY